MVCETPQTRWWRYLFDENDDAAADDDDDDNDDAGCGIGSDG